MKVQELPVRAWLAHLRRHPMPEIMDEECLAALSNVETRYGDTITHGAGLEVRLGNPARYVDYIMCVDQDRIPSIECIWYEIDYADFRRGGEISPCLFINTSDYKEEQADRPERNTAEEGAGQRREPFPAAESNVQRRAMPSGKAGGKKFWDTVLPPFAGEKRAARLRGQLDRVLSLLPQDATIKQVGTMSPRGELDILRLVVIFRRWNSIFAWLKDTGWPGDTEAMEQSLLPWKESDGFAVNIDLGEKGLLEKTGLEVFGRWRHPLIVDKFIARLEEEGLCLPSKGEALRRWIRIRPDGDPFIQTLISYFKLNYAKGRVTEAKAYLEQSPYIHHHYFDAYERPVRVDMELTDGILPISEETALARIRECGKNRAGCIRFYGGEDCEPMVHLLQACAAIGIRGEMVLAKHVRPARLEEMIAAGADSFLIEMGSEPDEFPQWARKLLKDIHFSNVCARWHMHGANAGNLAAVVKAAEEAGIRELVITGMKPGVIAKRDKAVPDRGQIAAAAEFIKAYNEQSKEWETAGKTGAGVRNAGMQIVVESCFSALRAYMEGEDPKRNGNRGIGRGCEAGRSFVALCADGSFAPCLYLKNGKGNRSGKTWLSLPEFWEQSPVLRDLRKNGEDRKSCAGCCYERRCLPCRAWEDPAAFCPFSDGKDTP